MSDDVFTQGYQGWEKRFQMGHRGEDVMQRAIEQEVMIAADAYQMRYGGGVARAVDIGAGDGRHTIYLASRGFDVLAVDAAPTGIERIREKLERESLSAQLTVADLRTYQLPDQIDLLLASYIVHLL
ncbi:MAG: class I SAM-dependent methyltransferase, partial [Chloroflexota bacterium]